MGKYFGTDGFRGEANVNLTYEHAVKIGRFLGWYYGQKEGKKAKIVIGKDTRRSSYMFEYALCTGLMASGADAYRMHVTTTPSVAYMTGKEDFACGIMISASHNPYYDNGIKLFNGCGEKMDEKTILEIEDYIDGKLEIPVATREVGAIIDYEEGRKAYAEHLASLCSVRFDGKKIGLDCANGASFALAKDLYEKLGATVCVMNDAPDGYNINTDCGSTHIEHLQKFVVDNKLDAGFAFDGDADRCLGVDEHGNVLTGDHIIYVYGKYMQEQGKLANNKVVTTVMSNFGLYKALDKAGIAYDKTSVGDKYVYENMVATGNMIGGEQSGHIIFKEYATTGDGMLTGIKMLEVMIAKNQTLGELASPVVFYPQVLKNVRVKSKPDAQNDPDVQAAVDKVSKELGDDGRILVRESGTEPVIRVMVEAGSDAVCEKYVDSVIKVIEEKGHLA